LLGLQQLLDAGSRRLSGRGLERANHLPVVEFGSIHVTVSDRQAVRSIDTNGERSVVEAGAFAEHQPCDQCLFAQRHWPARRIDQQHARVVGIEIVAQRYLRRRGGAEYGWLSYKVQVMSGCVVFTEILVMKLRLSARQAD